MSQPAAITCVQLGAPSVTGCGEGSQTESAEVRDSERRNPFNFQPTAAHLHKDHRLFEEGDVQRHMYLQDLYSHEADGTTTPSVSEFACHISGCSGIFNSLEDYEHHYNTLHRHVCSSCRRSLPSARLLDIHIQEWHDPLFTILAQRQDMYQCLVEGCGLKFSTSKNRKDHLIRIHKYPSDFRFDKSKKEKGARERERQQLKEAVEHEDMEVVRDVCESEGMCDLTCDAPVDQLEQTESMETQALKDKGACLFLSASAQDPSTEGQDREEHEARVKAQYSYRVPSTVCFGHGSVRGFRGRHGRRK